MALDVPELRRESRARSARSRQTLSTLVHDAEKGGGGGGGGDESGLRQREKGAAARGRRAEDESGGAGRRRIGAARISIIRVRSVAQRRGRGVLHIRKSPSEMLISFSRALSRNNPRTDGRTRRGARAKLGN